MGRAVLTKTRRDLVGRFHHHEFHHAAMSQLPLLYPSSFAVHGQPFLSFVEEGTGIEHGEGQLGSYWPPTGVQDLKAVKVQRPCLWHDPLVIHGLPCTPVGDQ